MNGGGGDGGGGRRISRPPSKDLREREEDLLLFREMQKREKEPIISLLQPVSDEFEANGNYALYRMASAKKGSGQEFLTESEKNDYDWLKTPPATPLFPSLEMESNAPEMVIQREIPILIPLSRFAGIAEAAKPTNKISRSPKPKVPLRSVTPSGRPSIPLTEKKNTKQAPITNPKTNHLSSTDPIKKSNSVSTPSKPMYQKVSQSHPNFLASNISKSVGMDSKTKPKSRGVSPLVRSTIPAQMPGFSLETPPNLITDRSTSASRGRSGSGNQSLSNRQTFEFSANARRQSCSPSVARGRKVEPKQEGDGNLTAQKGRIQTGNGTQILGSRMVDKFMNARKSSIEERATKLRLNSSINESSGFGRMMQKSSLDKALKHTETKRDSANFRQSGTTIGRKSTTIGKAPSS
ncbi:unnamed protein product [Ilex paraguariensis]|uniref:Uncharacterized protein n=1 Tax=Ilex paraguariensis TaxID=185542 RepID=A0ABC8UM32_9AQUA